jgi:TRAP transporter TAXI family solute receptor
MVLDGRVAALWGGGVGWPGFTAVTQANGRLIGLSAADQTRIRKKHNFLKPLVVPAGTYPNQIDVVNSVGSWSFVLARQSLDDELAYHLAKSIHRSYNNLVKRVAQGHETTPQNTVAAAPRTTNIHPGVQKYYREIGVIR